MEGRSVGIVNEASGQEVPAPDLEFVAQRDVTVHLAESVFKGLAGYLEDWILGLARLWLTAYPIQLDTAYHDAADRSRSQRRDEIQVPLSEILSAPDRDASRLSCLPYPDGLRSSSRRLRSNPPSSRGGRHGMMSSTAIGGSGWPAITTGTCWPGL